ncbi:MAG: amidase [Pedosphaera sp.]|nr:amidase [Pedosphaera sp.]
MNALPLNQLSIRDLSRAFHQGTIPVTQVTESALVKAQAQTRCRAFVWLDETGARSYATTLSEKPVTGPLWGIPVSVKDLFDVAQLPTTCGSPFYAGTRPVPSVDSTYAALWRSRNVVFTGKTTLNEFAYGITGENRCFGDCIQPEYPDRLTGGSSSGAAASVLMGAAMVGLGTDTGGSLRVPAALCGLVSYRGSVGLGDSTGSFPLARSFDTLGWLQRFIDDLPFVARALHPEIISPRWQGIPRVAILTGAWLEAAEEEVLRALNHFAETLIEAGAKVDRVGMAGWEKASDLFIPIQAYEAHADHTSFLKTYASAYDPAILARLKMGAGISLDRYNQLQEERQRFNRGFTDLFAEYDILVAPASAMRVLKVGSDQSATRPRLLRLTAPMSLGGLPALTLPWITEESPGTGFQCLANQGDDGRLWSFAEWLAEYLPSGAPIPRPVLTTAQVLTNSAGLKLGVG